MAPPVDPADRYEPLPGLLGLPGHFLRKLSARGRRVAWLVAGLLLAALVAGLIVLGPRISESKRERAAAERRAHAHALAQERVRLIAEQRPRKGKLEARPTAAREAYPAAALVAGVEEAITRDARARAATREFQNRARRTDCRTLGRARGRLLLECTAITSEQGRSEATEGLVVGYPYRAAVSTRDGSYALCKTSGRPAEGLLTRRQEVALPRACGG